MSWLGKATPKGVAFFNKTTVLAWSFLSESETQQGLKFAYGWALTGRGQDIVDAEWLAVQGDPPMSFKENLRAKIKLDRLLRKLVSTVREPPGKRWLDKALTRELLEMTDFEHRKVSGLQLYVRPLEKDMMEVVVLDNELAVYHTSVDDVALRRSPHWQEMFSVKNIGKIMKDQDVIVGKGKETIERLYANALALLNLSYTRDDLALLVEDARSALERESIGEIQESLDLFVELLDFEPLHLDVLERSVQIYAGPKRDGRAAPAFEHLILSDEQNRAIGLRKGPFFPQRDMDLAWVIQYSQGEKSADLEGMEVFEFLAELAMKRTQDVQAEK